MNQKAGRSLILCLFPSVQNSSNDTEDLYPGKPDLNLVRCTSKTASHHAGVLPLGALQVLTTQSPALLRRDDEAVAQRHTK